MKKLLLVLLVFTIASFLFVGCLPVTPSEGEGEGEGEGEVEVAITFDKEYTNASGVTYIRCGSPVTVTFPTPVEIDYMVYIGVKNDLGGYQFTQVMEPNVDRTIWTFEGGGDGPLGCEPMAKAEINNSELPIEGLFCIEECEPICIVALVKHPCCPGEEVALRVVSLDCTPPALDLFVKFTDCDDPCDDPDPCAEEFAGVSMEWTSRTTDICETEDCCNDTCSGVNGWSLVIDPDPCEGPCDTVTGVGCPVEGVLGCECLAFADTGEVCYYVEFYMDDNVGNALESRWKVCLDTDEVVFIDVDADYNGESFNPDYPGLFDGEWWQIFGHCTPIVPSG